MDPTYTLKPQLRIKITNIYLDETVIWYPDTPPPSGHNLDTFSIVPRSKNVLLYIYCTI